MSYILPREINVNMLAIDEQDKQALIKGLYLNKDGTFDFTPRQNRPFIKKFISIKDPVKLARRARAYVAIVGKPYKNETTWTEEYAIIANRLFEAGFDGLQIHDIASKTKANTPVLIPKNIL